MNTTCSHSTDAKYAWRELPPKGPPKRSASERVADFLEIYGPYDEATAREQASRCLQCPEPTCVTGCPLQARIPEWMLLTAEGQFLEAAALLHSTSSLPEVCARLCPSDRLCEGTCILNGHAEPVSIGAIEHFLSEYAFTHGTVEPGAVLPNGLRVAVVGSGPGGLACASELAGRGYAVTVFDSDLVPGGLLVNGVPAFKIEQSIVQRRIELLKKQGVVFRLGVTLGKDVSVRELRERFDAIFLGVNARQARPLDVPGADLQGVVQALPFILQYNSPLPLDIPPIEVRHKRVGVLGGGNTALDCLRTAIRCGARKVLSFYQRDAANMPGSPRDYENALEEGARFVFQTVPTAVLGDGQGRVTSLRLCRTELRAADANGRRPPYPVPGSEFEVPVDLVIVAYGFAPEPLPAGSDLAELKVNKWGGVVVDQDQMTSLPGVFAGGDIVRGPSLVVEAVRDGRRAAEGIHRFCHRKA